MLGVAKDLDILREAFRRFLVVTKEDSLGTVSGDIRRVLLRLALLHDEETVYQFLKELLEKNETLLPETQRDCLVVMGCVNNPSLHLEMLDYTFFSGKASEMLCDIIWLFPVFPKPNDCPLALHFNVGATARHRVSAKHTLWRE